jgi:hypothetical protein
MKSRASRSRVATLFSLVVASGLVAACSFLVRAERCDSDSDCAGRAVAAVCRSGSCVASGISAGDSGAKECTLNAECVTKLKAADAICVKQTNKCVRLFSVDCTRVSDEMKAKNDNAIFIGTLFKQGDGAGDVGASPDAIKAIEFAFNEFTQAPGGVPDPSGGPVRPLVAVECNQTQDVIRAAKFLSEELRVPAIIGASSSYVTVQAATSVTIKNGTMMISPFATSPGLTSLEDDGLVWRTCPSDSIQAQVVPAVVKQIVESENFKKVRNPSDKVRIAIVKKDDNYGKGLYDIIAGSLSINGETFEQAYSSGSIFVQTYPNMDNPSEENHDLGADADAVLKAGRFDIVILLGTSEIVKVLNALEQGDKWSPRPYFILPEGVAGVSSLLKAISEIPKAEDRLDLRRRIRGSIANFYDSTAYGQFYRNFEAGGPKGNAINGATAYDAAYTLAYAARAVGNAPITGKSLSTAMGRLVSGSNVFNVGNNDINNVFRVLNAEGTKVSLQGTSGMLDFDLATGDVRATRAATWCLAERTVTVAGAEKPEIYLVRTEQVFDSTTGTLSGTFPENPTSSDPKVDPCRFFAQ